MSYRVFISVLYIIYALPKAASAGSTFSFAQCAIDATAEFLSAPNSTFLIRSDGGFTDNLTVAWGISYESCNILCGPRGGWEPFDWPFFSAGISSWVLPWLALTAQLPYETRSSAKNFLSLLLAVGSPMLITTSLCVTILNCRWINKYFAGLRDKNERLGGKQVEIIEAARVFLRESQHVPIEVEASKAQFAQLVVLPENHVWWASLRKEIMKSKRGWTYSLLAQTAWVTIIEVIAIVDFFSPTTDNVIGVGVAVNNLWIWMIPVTLGWVWVGTQHSASSIREALTTAEASIGFSLRKTMGKMTGFRDNSYQTPLISRQLDLEGCLHEPSSPTLDHPEPGNEPPQDAIQMADTKVPRMEAGGISSITSIQKPVSKTVLGCSTAGFAEEPGPIFNYARVWNRLAVARYVGNAFHTLNSNLEAKRPLQGDLRAEGSRKWKDNFQGYRTQLLNADNIGSSTFGADEPSFPTITPAEIERYVFSNLDDTLPKSPSILNNYIIAVGVAFVLQWGTAGSSIFMAYKTPLVGLGCESGGYLFFAAIATVSWFLLVTSAYLSHIYSAHAVAYESSFSPTNGTTQVPGTVMPSNHARLSGLVIEPPSKLISFAIVLTRVAGIVLASGNAVWLVLLSSLQFTKMYKNCWCWGDVLQYGAADGWIPIWATADQFYNAALPSWIAGMIMSAVVLVFAGTFFVVMPGENLARRSTERLIR